MKILKSTNEKGEQLYSLDFTLQEYFAMKWYLIRYKAQSDSLNEKNAVSDLLNKMELAQQKLEQED